MTICYDRREDLLQIVCDRVKVTYDGWNVTLDGVEPDDAKAIGTLIDELEGALGSLDGCIGHLYEMGEPEGEEGDTE